MNNNISLGKDVRFLVRNKQKFFVEEILYNRNFNESIASSVIDPIDDIIFGFPYILRWIISERYEKSINLGESVERPIRNAVRQPPLRESVSPSIYALALNCSLNPIWNTIWRPIRTPIHDLLGLLIIRIT